MSLKPVLQRRLNAESFAGLAVFVFAFAVQEFHSNSHPFKRQPDQIRCDIFSILIGVIR